MRTDFDIIVREFPNRDDIMIIPVSDVHLGALEHMTDEWDKFCKDVLNQPNVYVTLGGDLINNATRTSVSNVFKETMRPSAQKRKMAEMLKPLAKDGRILCAVSGNHERRSGKDADDDPMSDIMCKLDLEDIYRENMAFVKVQMGEKNGNGNVNPTYMIAVNHGAGGGGMTGATVHKGERFGYALDGADALIIGHAHTPFVTQPSKIYIDKYNNNISLKPFKVVCATSWLYYGGDAAAKMLLPSGHAPQVMHLSGKHKEIRVTM